MPKQERDKFVFETLNPGECWHESSGMIWICGKCRSDVGWRGNSQDSVSVESLNPNLSTSEGFFWLWRRMRKYEDDVWHRFINYLHTDKLCAYISLCILIDFPDKFADAVWEFLKSEEGK